MHRLQVYMHMRSVFKHGVPYNTHSESVVDSAEALQLRHNDSVGGGASWNILQFGQIVWRVDLYSRHMEFFY